MSTENQTVAPEQHLANEIKSAVKEGVGEVVKQVQGLAQEIKSFQDYQKAREEDKKEFKSFEEKLKAESSEEIKSLKMEIDAIKQKEKKSHSVTSNATHNVSYDELYFDTGNTLGVTLASQKEIKSLDSNEEYRNKCNLLFDIAIKECKNHNIKEIFTEVKSTYNTLDANLGGAFNAAPLFIGLQRQLLYKSTIRQFAEVRLIRERQAEVKIIDQYANAKFLAEKEDYPEEKMFSVSGRIVKSAKGGIGAVVSEEVELQIGQGEKNGVSLIRELQSKMAESLVLLFDSTYTNGDTVAPDGAVLEGLCPQDADTVLWNGDLRAWDRKKVSYVKSKEVNTFSYDALTDLITSLPTSPSNVLMFNTLTYAHFLKMKDDAGNYILRQDYGYSMSEGGLVSGRIRNIPFIINDNMDNIAPGLFPVWFGDIQKSLLIFDTLSGGYPFIKRAPSKTGSTVNYVNNMYGGSLRKNTQFARLLKIEA